MGASSWSSIAGAPHPFPSAPLLWKTDSSVCPDESILVTGLFTGPSPSALRFEAGKPLAPRLFRYVPSAWLLGSERKVQPWTEPRASHSGFVQAEFCNARK